MRAVILLLVGSGMAIMGCLQHRLLLLVPLCFIGGLIIGEALDRIIDAYKRNKLK